MQIDNGRLNATGGRNKIDLRLSVHCLGVADCSVALFEYSLRLK